MPFDKMIDHNAAARTIESAAAGELERALAMVDRQARQAFPKPANEAFAKSCRELFLHAGTNVGLAYARHAPSCAAILGAEPGLALASAVAAVATDAGGLAACQLANAATRAARLLSAAAEFGQWLRAIRTLARHAPATIASVLSRTESLLGELGSAGFADWVAEGLRATERAPDRRIAFFVTGGRESRRALVRADAQSGFADLKRRLDAFLRAGWGVSPQLIEAAPRADAPPPRRTSFDAEHVRAPAQFRGFAGDESVRLFTASVAHVAAHLAHGAAKTFPIAGLKPTQIVLVSLIEDARVEHLAMIALPGLRRLWLPFHVARASRGLATAGALMARLARALLDPGFVDDNSWVEKGRALFAARLDRISDPAISREIGGLLGHDLGQLRLQFDARAHVVEPVYRDDNTGLWDFPADGAPSEEDATVRSVRLEATDEPSPNPAEQDQQAGPHDDAGEARPVLIETDIGVPVARYPEWDHLIGRDRQDWATIVEYEPRVGDARSIDLMIAHDPGLVGRISCLVRSAKVGRPKRLRRQREGDQLDLDAAISATIDRRMGLPADSPVHTRQERQVRDLSVLLLLDASRSTNDIVAGVGRSVLAMEMEAAALLSHAMSGLGDPFALRAFCSDGRSDVRYFRIKDFQRPYDAAARARLAGLTGQYSTRIGTALRHAGRELAAQQAYRRLLLVITDGEPSDIDVSDRRYLVEDARRAVQLLAAAGIDAFCVGLHGSGEAQLHRAFGRRNVLHVDRLDRLPERLASLYFRLAG